MRSNYFGIFDTYNPGVGCTRTLVMAGVFAPSDLYKVNLLIDEEINNTSKVEYYGDRHL